jgi:transcriptional regulator with XRE-family HTH domain
MADEEKMGQRLTKQMEVANLNQSEVARILGVSRMTVSQWCRDISEPRSEHLIKLAEMFFGGDVHYFVFGRSRQPEGGFPKPPGSSPGPHDTAFISPFRRRRKT